MAPEPKRNGLSPLKKLMNTKMPLNSSNHLVGLSRPVGRCIAKTKVGALLLSAAAMIAPLAASAQSATTWGPATTISADSDVYTNGNPLYAYAGGITAGTTNVFGVSFTAGTGYAAWGNVAFTSGFSGSSATAFGPAAAPFNGLTNTYQTILRGGAYGGVVVGTVTLKGLTPSHDYAVQIWVNDTRANSHTEVTSGNAVTLTYNNYGSLGGVGQYSVGTFTASSTNQAFTLTPSAAGSVQLNAISVRDEGAPVRTWVGTGGTLWGTASDWSPAVVPFPGDSVVFNAASTANLATMLDAAYTVGALTLSNAPAAVSVGPDTFTLAVNSGINLLGTSDRLTINDALVLSASQTWTNNGILSISNTISSTSPVTLTLAGTGVVSLSSPATYTNNTVINGGTLALTGAGTLAGTNITMAGGAVLDVSAASPTFALSGHVLSNSSGGAVINGTTDSTSGPISMQYDLDLIHI